MKRGLNICCGVLALALLFGGCAQSVPQQEQEPKAEPVAAGAFAAEVEPEYLQHAAYMSAPKGFFANMRITLIIAVVELCGVRANKDL